MAMNMGINPNKWNDCEGVRPRNALMETAERAMPGKGVEAQTSELDLALSLLKSRVSDIHSAITRLGNKLEPVSYPERDLPSEPGDPAPSPICKPVEPPIMLKIVRDQVDGCNAALERMEYLIQRLVV